MASASHTLLVDPHRHVGAAFALGTLNVVLFGILTRDVFLGVLFSSPAFAIGLWAACIVAALFALGQERLAPMTTPVAGRLFARGLLAGAALGALTGMAFTMGEPKTWIWSGSIGAFIGLAIGGACAVFDISLISFFGALRKRRN